VHQHNASTISNIAWSSGKLTRNYLCSLVLTITSAGIGVTPFSGVLTDLQHHELERARTNELSPESSDGTTLKEDSPYKDHRRVDFHWMVRDRNNLLWFSDLLNEVSRAQELDRSHLDIRVQTYVTQKRKQISQHVFRWLLEKHRTDDFPYSPITGLVNPTHFGRPDIRGIMEEHYADMCKVLAGRTPMNEKPGARRGSKIRRSSMINDEVKVGVFFCGPPVIGQQLADQCSQMSAKARNEGRKIEYRFMIEVFG
jgi:dual oxidase